MCPNPDMSQSESSLSMGLGLGLQRGPFVSQSQYVTVRELFMRGVRLRATEGSLCVPIPICHSQRARYRRVSLCPNSNMSQLERSLCMGLALGLQRGPFVSQSRYVTVRELFMHGVRLRATEGSLCVPIPICHSQRPFMHGVRLRATEGSLCVPIPICHSKRVLYAWG